MTEARVNAFVGYHDRKTVIGVFAPTPGVREVGERALKTVMQHEDIGTSSAEIVEAPQAPWMAAIADPNRTDQETIDLLGSFGSVEYVDDLSRADVARFIGPQATNQLLGRRPGVL